MNNFSNRVFTNADQEVMQYDGQAVSWRVSAYALIVQEDSILIIKNRNEKLYDVPGGGIEFGESIEEALERELMEEAGAKAAIGNIIHVEQGFFKHGNGNFYQTIQMFYSAKLVGELVEATEGTTEFVGFVKFDELEKYPLPKAAKAAVAKLKGFL
ncbi:MAG: NUDIX domain-containing protein [Patescibacteria group bacterium]